MRLIFEMPLLKIYWLDKYSEREFVGTINDIIRCQQRHNDQRNGFLLYLQNWDDKLIKKNV